MYRMRCSPIRPLESRVRGEPDTGCNNWRSLILYLFETQNTENALKGRSILLPRFGSRSKYCEENDSIQHVDPLIPLNAEDPPHVSSPVVYSQLKDAV